MTYQEREISKNQLEKIVKSLDLDEGIRLENKSNMIFLNKSAKRYCIDTYTHGNDVFAYCNGPQEVLDFLKDKMDNNCKIFWY